MLIPDDSWLLLNDSRNEVVTIDSIETGNFVTLLSEEIQCSKQIIKTYRYKTIKEYYDNEYHSNIEGYLPDYSDYKVYYNGEEIKKQIKYLKGEDKIIYSDISSNQKETKNEPIKEIEYRYIDKYQTIEKVPSKIKYLIFLLILIILFFIGICLKMSSENNS